MIRTSARWRLATLTLAISLSASACSEAPNSAEDLPDDDDRARPATTALTQAQRDVAVERGDAAASRLAGALGSTLQERIRTEGLVGAVEFCDLLALPLTDQVTEELGVTVARTSARVRNPANAPDAVDRRALAAFADTSGGAVPHHLEVVGDTAVRYYKPLYASELCVRCHGPAGSLDPALGQVLRERYPEDRATGYQPGDLRGVIRVTLPREGLVPEASGP